MTVTLVWQCDVCAVTDERVVRDAASLATPAGWTATLTGDEYEHTCPSCQAEARVP